MNEPWLNAPVVEEGAVDEPWLNAPVAEERSVNEPWLNAPVVEEGAVNEPWLNAPVVEEGAVNEPWLNAPVVGEAPRSGSAGPAPEMEMARAGNVLTNPRLAMGMKPEVYQQERVEAVAKRDAPSVWNHFWGEVGAAAREIVPNTLDVLTAVGTSPERERDVLRENWSLGSFARDWAGKSVRGVLSALMPFPKEVRETVNESAVKALAERNKERQARVQKRFDELPEVYRGRFLENPSLERAVVGAAGSVPGMLVAMWNPAVGAALMAGQEAGPAYEEMLAEGVDPQEANGRVALFAVGSYFLEKLGVDTALGRVLKNSRVAQWTGNHAVATGLMMTAVSAGTEGGTEVLQETWQYLVKNGMEISWDEFVKEVDLWETLAVGSLMGGTMAGVNQVARAADGGGGSGLDGGAGSQALVSEQESFGTEADFEVWMDEQEAQARDFEAWLQQRMEERAADEAELNALEEADRMQELRQDLDRGAAAAAFDAEVRGAGDAVDITGTVRGVPEGVRVEARSPEAIAWRDRADVGFEQGVSAARNRLLRQSLWDIPDLRAVFQGDVLEGRFVQGRKWGIARKGLPDEVWERIPKRFKNAKNGMTVDEALNLLDQSIRMTEDTVKPGLPDQRDDQFEFLADMLSVSKEQMVEGQLREEVENLSRLPARVSREVLLDMPNDELMRRVQGLDRGEDPGFTLKVAELQQGDVVVVDGKGYQVIEAGKVKYLRDGEIIELGNKGNLDVDVAVPVGHAMHERALAAFAAQEAAEGQGAGAESLAFADAGSVEAGDVVSFDTGAEVPTVGTEAEAASEVRNEAGFGLESVSEGDLVAEQEAEARARQREKMRERQQAPLRGDSMDVGQGQLFDDPNTGGQQDLLGGLTAEAEAQVKRNQQSAAQEKVSEKSGQSETMREINRMMEEARKHIDRLKNEIAESNNVEQYIRSAESFRGRSDFPGAATSAWAFVIPSNVSDVRMDISKLLEYAVKRSDSLSNHMDELRALVKKHDLLDGAIAVHEGVKIPGGQLFYDADGFRHAVFQVPLSESEFVGAMVKAYKRHAEIKMTAEAEAEAQAARAAMERGEGTTPAQKRLEELRAQGEASRVNRKAGVGAVAGRLPWLQEGKPLMSPEAEQKPVQEAALTDSADAEVNKRLNVASRAPRKSWRDISLEDAKVFIRGFVRTFPEIPDHMGLAHTLLHLLPAQKIVSQREAGDFVRLVTEGLGKEQYALLERILVARDVLRSISDGLYEGKPLPFGWADVAAVERDLARWEAVAAVNPDVMEALDRRRKVWDAVRERAIEAGVLDEAFREDRDYFHRIVMEYLETEQGGATGQGLKETKKGFQKKRKGGGDFLIDYASAEQKVLADIFYQIHMSRIRAQFEDAYDVKKQVRQTAKMHNLVAVHGGEKNYQRVQQVLNQVREMRREGLNPKSWRHIMDSIENIDVLRPFRAKKAMAISILENVTGKKLPDLLDYGVEDPTGAFQAAIKGELGEDARGAGAVWFKAIAEEEAFVRKSLGDGYWRWKNAVDKRAVPEGYEVYEFKPGHVMYKALTVSEQILDKVMEKAMELVPEHVKEALAVAGKHPPWVIPKEIARALNHLDKVAQKDSYSTMISKATSLWSANKLLAPWHTLPYNLRNAWSDFEMVLQFPGILGYTKEAAKISWDFNRGGKLMDDITQEMMELGVLGGQAFTELGEFGRSKFMQAVTGENPGVLGAYLEENQSLSQAREDVMRIASYLYFKKELQSGRRIYGPSVRKHIDDLLDRGEVNMAAAQLAKDTLHDYQNPTRFGKFMRHKLGVPFFRFREANTIRIARLLANIGADAEALARVMDADFYQTKAGKALLVARISSIRMAMMTAIYAFVQAWNYYRDEEEAEKLRRQGKAGSIYLGRDQVGNALTFNADGAFVAFVRQFGIQEPFRDFRDLATGEKSPAQFGEMMRRGTWAELVNIQSPFSKAVLEHAFGTQFWPDPAMGRPLHDPVENYLRMISANKLYRRVTGKPVHPAERTLMGSMTGWILKRSDVEGDSYYLVREMVQNYRRDVMDRASYQGGRVENDNQRGYFRNMYMQAIRYEDPAAEKRWLERYFEAGGTVAGLKRTEGNRHPLHGIPNAERARFIRSLSEQDKRMVREALAYYERGRVMQMRSPEARELLRQQIRLERR